VVPIPSLANIISTAAHENPLKRDVPFCRIFDTGDNLFVALLTAPKEFATQNIIRKGLPLEEDPHFKKSKPR
jgi:hypothetical protein